MLTLHKISNLFVLSDPGVPLLPEEDDEEDDDFLDDYLANKGKD